MFGLTFKTIEMVKPETALQGRQNTLPTAETHFINGRPLTLKIPAGMEAAMFGMGFFGGVERLCCTNRRVAGVTV